MTGAEMMFEDWLGDKQTEVQETKQVLKKVNAYLPGNVHEP